MYKIKLPSKMKSIFKSKPHKLNNPYVAFYLWTVNKLPRKSKKLMKALYGEKTTVFGLPPNMVPDVTKFSLLEVDAGELYNLIREQVSKTKNPKTQIDYLTFSFGPRTIRENEDSYEAGYVYVDEIWYCEK